MPSTPESPQGNSHREFASGIMIITGVILVAGAAFIPHLRENVQVTVGTIGVTSFLVGTFLAYDSGAVKYGEEDESDSPQDE